MTRTVGWINDGRDGLPGSSTSFKHSPKWPSLPTNAPECLRKINVAVRDPERVLLVDEAKRRGDFQLLVKRYVRQSTYRRQEPCACVCTDIVIHLIDSLYSCAMAVNTRHAGHLLASPSGAGYHEPRFAGSHRSALGRWLAIWPLRKMPKSFSVPIYHFQDLG